MLQTYSAVGQRKAELVELRHFVVMNFEEAAASLGIAVRLARQW